MDSHLRLRIDIGLVLLAAIAGTTSVAAYGAADVATVAAGIVAAVLPTVVLLLVGPRPE